MSNPTELIENHLLWLKEKTVVEQLDDSIEITTPYLDSHNDQIQVYVLEEDGKLILADNGYTLAGGCICENILQAIKDFNLTKNDGELTIHTTESDFNHDFLRFISALSVVSYLSNQE